MDSLPVEKPRVRRAVTSCRECQRRKQKCNRDWPCKHCQTRMVPHLCKFAVKRKRRTARARTLAASNGGLIQSRKGKENDFDVNHEASSSSSEDHEMVLVDGLAKLGYMPTHQVFDIGLASGDPAIRFEEYVQGQREEVEIALKSILPKPYTECLVQNFLQGNNFQYYSIYPQQLQELELGEKAQVLTDRFHAAALRLSNTVSPGRGGLAQVQQLFLTASWYKSEAHMVEAWHALSNACRQAQELGMHRDADIIGMTGFEREMRARMWCILYAWDWQMSTLLGRPMLIDHNDSVLRLPDGILEAVPGDPDLPSPICHVVLQAQLGQRISERFQSINDHLTAEQTIAIRQELQDWMNSFPPVYRATDPDTHWDDAYPYLKFQRNQLTVIGYCYMLRPLKPWISGIADETASPLAWGFRVAGVDICLDIIRLSERFCEVIYPDNAKYFFTLFFIFDAATVLCSAIYHDVEGNLPQRYQAVQALRSALIVIDEVCHLTKTAVVSYIILKQLVRGLPLTPYEKAVLDVGSPKNLGIDSSTLQHALVSGNVCLQSLLQVPTAGPVGFVPYVPPTMPEWQVPEMPPLTPHAELAADFVNTGVQHIAPIWNWQILNVDLSEPFSTLVL
ncbi:Pyrimidine pathway regulatory protein 1 [Pleurostoma richardsiae]|uniref:Pyrimidine pathway regulatory protein 1 n=1 Tax=Pleurostoma richardsiae TaxID=41990 RepID=A0AA38RVI2_9PEZI|nr:Pyrimidine pathway regulatory protein 1 [Pleurostoma richardsiae]